MKSCIVTLISIIILVMLYSKSSELVYFSNTNEGKVIAVLVIVMVTYLQGLRYGIALGILYVLALEYYSTSSNVLDLENTMMVDNMSCDRCSRSDSIDNVKYKLLSNECNCKGCNKKPKVDIIDQNERIVNEHKLVPKPSNNI